jgi:dipeptidyl aminopeptidase/acylaminoacyl peptidase
VDFEHGLNKAINKVREALGDNADNPRFIETLPRRGYRFLLPATKTTEPPAVDRPASVDHTPEQPLVASIPAKSWRIALAALAAGVIVVVLIFAYRFWHHGHGGETEGLRLSRLTDNRRTERVAISPDGRYVVYAAEEGERLGLWIRQVLTRSSTVEIVPPDVVEFAGLTFSPDGNYVYFVRGGRGNAVSHSLFVTPVLGGLARLLLSGIDSPVSFSPDGHQIVYTRRTADENALELRIADVEGNERSPLGDPARCSSFSPGRSSVVTGWPHHCRFRDAQWKKSAMGP